MCIFFVVECVDGVPKFLGSELREEISRSKSDSVRALSGDPLDIDKGVKRVSG